MKIRCNLCEGTGKLGFQQEDCCSCFGEGVINVKYENNCNKCCTYCFEDQSKCKHSCYGGELCCNCKMYEKFFRKLK